MRLTLSIKTLYRSPVRTILTFILLGVLTFAFFSQTAEYTITVREMNSAAGQYVGVGAVEIAPPEEIDTRLPLYINTDLRMAQQYPEERQELYLNKIRYQPLSQDQISTISELPYITLTDTRYMTAGVSDTYYRLDEGANYYNYPLRCVVEATLTDIQYREDSSMEDYNFNRLILDDFTLLAGNFWYVDNDKPLVVNAYPDKLDDFGTSPEFPAMFVGLMNSSGIWYTSSYTYDTEYVKTLVQGNRYVFILRSSLLFINSKDNEQDFYLGDHLTNLWCEAIQPIDGEPENYLETEKYITLRELVELTNADMHTFDMAYTEDMRSIMRFAQGDMAITDGRMLSKEDSENGSNICVVSHDFAAVYELELGDIITMRLGTELFEQYKGLGAVAATWERYNSAEKTVKLEIVGIYIDTDGPTNQSRNLNWSYSINTIFVPKSLLPVVEKTLTNHMFSPSEFSFMVENAWDIETFFEESAPVIEEMGLTLIFDDGGWPQIAQSFQSASRLSVIKIVLLAVAVTIATGFVVYLFVGRKKRDYAVMRALGTTKKISARTLVFPLMAVTVLSVLAGSGVAWRYTVRTIANNNTLSAMKDFAVNTNIPTGVVVSCVLGIILLTLLIALAMLRRAGSLPPLVLLHDSPSKTRRKRRTSNKTQNEEVTAVLEMTSALTPPPVEHDAPDTPIHGHRWRCVRFVLCYIWRHMSRSTVKSLLAVLVAALFFGVGGQLALMRQTYVDICENLVITANFIGGLGLDIVSSVIRTGYFSDPYYEAVITAELNSSMTDIVVTNNIERYAGEEVDITYANGYDASCMDKFGEIIIVGKTLMETFRLEPGGTVQITRQDLLAQMRYEHISSYRTRHPGEEITDDEILSLYQDELMKAINEAARTYTIAGVILTSSDRTNNKAFMPGMGQSSEIYGNMFNISLTPLDMAEFKLVDNLRADEVREYGERVAKSFGVVFLMDTSKLENPRNTMRLLEALYPVTLVAALLIGGFLCCLVILQSSKEAAIMRILGTTNRKTRVLLALEQVILGIAGLAVGVCGLLLYQGHELTAISWQLYLFAVLYFCVILVSTIICAILVTRHSTLGLLQTKE